MRMPSTYERFFSTTSVKSTYAPGFRSASSRSSATEYGIAIASMYPGMAAQEATKLRCGRSTSRTIPVTGYRVAAVRPRAARSNKAEALAAILPPQLVVGPFDHAVLIGGLPDLDRLV